MPNPGNALKGTAPNKNLKWEKCARGGRAPVGAWHAVGLRRKTGHPECEWVAGSLHAPARVPGDHRRPAHRGQPVTAAGRHPGNRSSAHLDAEAGPPPWDLAYGRQTRLCTQSPVLACPSGARGGRGRRPGSVRGSGWPQAERPAPSTVPSGTFIGGSVHARLPALPTPSLPGGWRRARRCWGPRGPARLTHGSAEHADVTVPRGMGSPGPGRAVETRTRRLGLELYLLITRCVALGRSLSLSGLLRPRVYHRPMVS